MTLLAEVSEIELKNVRVVKSPYRCQNLEFVARVKMASIFTASAAFGRKLPLAARPCTEYKTARANS